MQVHVKEAQSLAPNLTNGELFVLNGMTGFQQRSGVALPSIEQIERAYIELLLRKTKNKMHVANILGVTQKTLYNKLHRYGLAQKYVGANEV